jgi:hypothetical protein
MTTFTIHVSEIKFNNSHTIELQDEDILEVQGYFEDNSFYVDSVNWITVDNDISNDLVNILHKDTLDTIAEKVVEKAADDYENQRQADFDFAYEQYRDSRMVEA